MGIEENINCLLCNGTNFTLFHDKGRGDSNVRNYSCDSCGFILILPRLTSNQKNDLYKEGQFSEKERNNKTLSDQKIKQSERIAFEYFKVLEKFLEEKIFESNKSCLEIGCGAGSFLRYMKAVGWNVEGIEPDAEFSQRGAEIYDLDIKNDFLEDFKSDNKYNLISSFHVIEHVDDPNDFLSKIWNLLEKDGLLFLECPSIDYLYGPSVDFFFWDVHINTFSNKTLQAFLVKNGFEILQIIKRGGFVNVIAKKVSHRTEFVQYFDGIKRTNELLTERKYFLSNKTIKLKKLYKKIFKVKRKVIKRVKVETISALRPKSKYIFSHLGFHHSKNTGDIALFVSLRKQFQRFFGDIEFNLLNLHEVVNDRIVKKINKTDALIIGGGGLFLKDTNPNDISGWQWPCSLDYIKKIKVPIIIYAVGYNRFRDQADFEDFFKENINMLFEKAIFIGLRNRGSIKKISKYLSDSNKEKIVYQPCSTTLLNDFYPSFKATEGTQKTVAFNLAFDRHYLRYGSADKENEILNSICIVIKKLIENNNKVVFLSHVIEDVQFNIWLKSNGVIIDHVNLVGKPLEEVIRVYKSFNLVVGTRGHSQMMPFGMNIPIISLISHDKLKYFLEDNDLTDKGVDVNNLNLEIVLYELIKKELVNPTDFESRQEHIRNITTDNLQLIKSQVDKHKGIK